MAKRRRRRTVVERLVDVCREYVKVDRSGRLDPILYRECRRIVSNKSYAEKLKKELGSHALNTIIKRIRNTIHSIKGYSKHRSMIIYRKPVPLSKVKKALLREFPSSKYIVDIDKDGVYIEYRNLYISKKHGIRRPVCRLVFYHDKKGIKKIAYMMYEARALKKIEKALLKATKT